MAFGAQSTSTPAFGGFSFGASTSTTSTPSFASSAFANPSVSTGATGTGFTFGQPATTTTQSLFGGSTFSAPAATTALTAFGQPATTANTGFSFGGFGATSTPSNQTLSFGGIGGGTGLTTGIPAVTSAAPAIVGLGGVDLQASNITGPDGVSKKEKAIKETFIPNEILVTYEAYKKFIKEQKSVREEMFRMSSKDIIKVQSRVSLLKQQLSVVSNGIQRNAKAIAKLKQDTSEELRNAEIIQRTKDTPPALQYENTAPSTYFHNLVINFENQMQVYRQQIEQLERHLMSLSQPTTMTPNELAFVMKRIHDAFVTLAAQLQIVHQQIQHQKEQLAHILDLNQTPMSSVFQSRENSANEVPPSVSILPPVTAGPSPVSAGSDLSSVAMACIQNRAQHLRELVAANPSILQKSITIFGAQTSSILKPLGQSSGISFGNPSLVGGGTGFSSDSASQSAVFGASNQKPFMLQKPPSGNKRGKRWTSS